MLATMLTMQSRNEILGGVSWPQRPINPSDILALSLRPIDTWIARSGPDAYVALMRAIDMRTQNLGG